MDERTRTALAGMKIELERLLGGWRLGASELADAPQIQDWQIIRYQGAMRLLGKVTGHPVPGVGVKPQTMTSDILWIDQNEGWARTASRFYMLGSHAADVERHFTREEVTAYACLQCGIEPPDHILRAAAGP